MIGFEADARDELDLGSDSGYSANAQQIRVAQVTESSRRSDASGAVEEAVRSVEVDAPNRLAYGGGGCIADRRCES